MSIGRKHIQIFKTDKCIDICCKNTNEYVRLAVNDLIKDIERVSESSHIPKLVKEPTKWCIIIEENDKRKPMGNESEDFTIRSEGDTVIICGCGYLGTMWGIYTFSDKILGVDPCYIFNDLEIQKRKELEWCGDTIAEKPNGFRFRGVFINDEDFLAGWKDGGGIRYIDWQSDNITVAESVIDMVVETVLRLKFNLIIPATFINIDNPPEKNIIDRAAMRGLFVSQHHIEPLGVSAYTFNNYCAKYDRKGEFSYIKNPELMKEVWNYYAEKWAKYDNVIWQIGLRGEGDRPVWQEEKIHSEDVLIRYGEQISDAMKTQIDIIKNVTGGRAKYFTTTLWMEGSMLMEKGMLKIPEEATIVFADNGPNQMFAPEFYLQKQDSSISYGVYYHLQYYNLGPHLAPMTGINKLYYNIKLCYDINDRDYFIINCSNVREFIFELKACSQMVWDFKSFSSEKYMDEYASQFGENKDQVKVLINGYYDSIAELDMSMLKYMYGNYFNYDYSHRPEGIKLCPLKDGGVLCKGALLMRYFRLDFKKMPDGELYMEMYPALKKAIADYKNIIRGFEELCCNSDCRITLHIKAKWLNYSYAISCIYSWFVKLYEAKLFYDAGDAVGFMESLEAACSSLELYLKYRENAEYGIFENWYRGDILSDVKQLHYNTNRLMGRTSK